MATARGVTSELPLWASARPFCLRLITRRLWTDIRWTDIRFGVCGSGFAPTETIPRQHFPTTPDLESDFMMSVHGRRVISLTRLAARVPEWEL